MSEQEVSEKLETLRNLLLSYATGGHVENDEYQRRRAELLKHKVLRDRLPRFVRTCQDLKQFWAFIKQQSDTYEGRRIYLWGEFNPLIEDLATLSEAPPDRRVDAALTKLDSDTLVQAWRDALDRRLTDPDGAITSARSLLESVCKHILDDSDVPYEARTDLPGLYRLTADALQLAPSQQTEDTLRRVLGGCITVVDGVGAMRNALGDAHGRGRSSVKPESRHAELAVNLAGAAATFLVQTWEAKRETAI